MTNNKLYSEDLAPVPVSKRTYMLASSLIGGMNWWQAIDTIFLVNIEDLCEGLNNWMDEKGFKTITDFIGRSVPYLTQWEELDINYHIVAKIDQDKCIHCGLCYIACEDASHQSINLQYGKPYNTYSIKEEECVGCNLCKVICPVDNCITMVEQRKGPDHVNWKEFQRRGLPLNDH